MQKVEYITTEKVTGIMRRLDFFSAFTNPELARLSEFHTNFFVYEKDEKIIEEGNLSNAFYIILSGGVVVVKGNVRMPIARLEPGDFFGEIAFLTGVPRTSGVISDDTTITIRINRSMLDRLTPEIREKIKDKIILKLIERLGKMNDVVASLTE
jgi:CRP-like cAMP-binding protein